MATGWKDVTFDHTKTRFALTGAHATPACAACHADGRYVGTPTTCIGCHAGDDKHNGALGTDCAVVPQGDDLGGRVVRPRQGDVPADRGPPQRDLPEVPRRGPVQGHADRVLGLPREPASHGSAFGGSCASCHTTTAWLPATFNHNKATFPLTGAHRSVTCQQCHGGGQYKGTPTTCAACHAKPASHGSAYGSSCASCHTTTAWLPATFNHAKTSFPLTGAHQSVDLPALPQGRPVQGHADHVRGLSHQALLARQRLQQQLRVLPHDHGLAAGEVRRAAPVPPEPRWRRRDLLEMSPVLVDQLLVRPLSLEHALASWWGDDDLREVPPAR